MKLIAVVRIKAAKILLGGADQYKGRQPSTMDQKIQASQKPSVGTNNLSSSGPSQKSPDRTSHLAGSWSEKPSSLVMLFQGLAVG